MLGTQAFDQRVKIAGVILNRVGGGRHEAKLRAAVEHYTDIPVLGAVANDPKLAILERHLGLIPSNETGDAGEQIRRLAAQIAQSVDLDALLAATKTHIAAAAPSPAVDKSANRLRKLKKNSMVDPADESRIRRLLPYEL